MGYFKSVDKIILNNLKKQMSLSKNKKLIWNWDWDNIYRRYCLSINILYRFLIVSKKVVVELFIYLYYASLFSNLLCELLANHW